MTLALLVALGQIADGLALQAAYAHGVEANPAAAALLAAFGPTGVLGIKMAAAAVLGIGAVALRRRRSLVAWLALAGFAGALTELAVLA